MTLRDVLSKKFYETRLAIPFNEWKDEWKKKKYPGIFFIIIIFIVLENGKIETVREGYLCGFSKFPLTEKSYRVSETALKNKSRLLLYITSISHSYGTIFLCFQKVKLTHNAIKSIILTLPPSYYFGTGKRNRINRKKIILLHPFHYDKNILLQDFHGGSDWANLTSASCEN